MHLNFGYARAFGLVLALVAPSLSAMAAPAQNSTPSFKCSRASNQAERWICGSDRLAVLDSILGRYYPAISQAMPSAQRQCFVANQRDWLQGTRNRCDSVACLELAYLRRLTELEGLVPGALQDSGLEAYPAVSQPRLLAVLPPSSTEPLPEDELQPVLIEGEPQEDEGGYLLVSEDFDRDAWDAFNSLQGDEAGLRARFGDGPVLVDGLLGSFSGLELDTRARAAIDAVVSQRGKLRVSGWAIYTDAAPPALDGRRCGLIHALP